MKKLRQQFITNTLFEATKRRRPSGCFDKFEKGYISSPVLKKYKNEHSIFYNKVLKELQDINLN